MKKRALAQKLLVHPGKEMAKSQSLEVEHILARFNPQHLPASLPTEGDMKDPEPDETVESCCQSELPILT